jgi:hypothetical protein
MPNNGNQVLNSWKDIANYLQVSVRTAQLWEEHRGLPVRRVPGGRGVVWADPAELDTWRKSASSARPNGALAATPTAGASSAAPDAARANPLSTALADPPTGRRTILLGLVGAAYLVLVAWVVLSGNPRRDDTARSVPLATSPGDEWEATFSPEGAQVAYVWNGDSGAEPLNLYVKPVAGGTPRRLTNGAWRDQFPQWSPDGRWIALGRRKGSAVDILLVSPDGVQQRSLAHMESPAYRGQTGVQWVSWAPDSKSVAIIERPSLDEP